MGGCARSGPREGEAFQEPYETWIGMPPVSPGDQWVLIIAYMKNVTPTTVRLESVRLEGSGLGGVVRVLKTEIGPLDDFEGYDFVSSGVYQTYPPAEHRHPGDRCNVQTLVPVDGYELAPGGGAQVAVLLEAVGTGRFRINQHVISYEQDGAEYVQSLPVGLRGRVVDGVDPRRIWRWQRPCAEVTRILP